MKCLYNQSLNLRKFLAFLLSFLPFIKWIENYQWRSYLFGDLISGITVGILCVPQGIAYALLLGLNPISGLFSAFYPPLLYAVFGTSKHTSIGPYAIVSLMTSAAISRIREAIHQNHLNEEASYIEKQIESGDGIVTNLQNLTRNVPFQMENVTNLQIITALTVCIGIIHISMALAHVELFVCYLSDQLISAFSSAASVHVIIVQLDKIFQIEADQEAGPGMAFKHLMMMTIRINETNVPTLLIAAFGLIILYVGKDLLNPQVVRRLKVPIPFELVLVALMITLSHALNLQNYGVKVVGIVPAGLPVAKMPYTELFPYVLPHAAEIAFVIAAIHLSTSKIFSRRYDYETDDNQDLYALGIIGLISAAFSSYPVASAIGRSTVSSQCGAKTQLSGFFTSMLVLSVILWLGPLMEALPMCILAIIIIFSLKTVFNKTHEVVQLWNISKWDFAIWIVAFFSTVATDALWGLTISVIFALSTIIFRLQWPRWCTLSQLHAHEEYCSTKCYDGETIDFSSIFILRYEAPLLFINVAHFRNTVTKILHSSNTSARSNYDQLIEDKYREVGDKRSEQKKNPGELEAMDSDVEEEDPTRHLIIDCAGITMIDMMGVHAIAEIINRLKNNGTETYLAATTEPVKKMLEQFSARNFIEIDHIHSTVGDAIHSASYSGKTRQKAKTEANWTDNHAKRQIISVSDTAPIMISSPSRQPSSLQISNAQNLNESNCMDVPIPSSTDRTVQMRNIVASHV